MAFGRRRGRGVALVLAGLLAAGGGLACSPLTRHRVLSFFFDGVPPYRTAEERARLEEQQKAQREARRVARRRREHRAEKVQAFVHGPYAAKECGRCHDLTRTTGFRKARAGLGAGGALAKAALAEGGRLRLPVIDLCVDCHTDFRVRPEDRGRVWTHGPVASGWCVICHLPHSSRYVRLLRTRPVAKLCLQCHEVEELLASTPKHRPASPAEGYPPLPRTGKPASGGEGGGGESAATVGEAPQVTKACIRCHDPHRARRRFMLRAEPLPAALPPPAVPEGIEPGHPPPKEGPVAAEEVRG